MPSPQATSGPACRALSIAKHASPLALTFWEVADDERSVAKGDCVSQFEERIKRIKKIEAKLAEPQKTVRVELVPVVAGTLIVERVAAEDDRIKQLEERIRKLEARLPAVPQAEWFEVAVTAFVRVEEDEVDRKGDRAMQFEEQLKKVELELSKLREAWQTLKSTGAFGRPHSP